MSTLKICLICGKAFTDPKHPNRKYCSQECVHAAQSRKETRNCEICGGDFICIPSKPKRFCSAKCANSRQQKDEAKHALFTCKRCGKVFEEYAYRSPSFCSNQCRSEYAARQPKPKARKPLNRITLNCKVCGKEYQTSIHQIRLRGGTCCSRECVNILQSQLKRADGNPNYRGGAVRHRGANWGRQSRAALKRDGYRCQICNKRLGRKGYDYGVHHIIPYREFDGDFESANQLTNLITLCRSCHAKVEHGNLPCPRPLF